MITKSGLKLGIALPQGPRDGRIDITAVRDYAQQTVGQTRSRARGLLRQVLCRPGDSYAAIAAFLWMAVRRDGSDGRDVCMAVTIYLKSGTVVPVREAARREVVFWKGQRGEKAQYHVLLCYDAQDREVARFKLDEIAGYVVHENPDDLRASEPKPT